MNCLICGAQAQRMKTEEDCVELQCPQCGHYRVTGDLFAHMKPRGQSFDIVKAREWLAAKRTGAEKAPMIGCPDSGLIGS
ncbi:MAG: hypothetical protein ACOH2R_23150 [Pseudomonas sp.]